MYTEHVLVLHMHTFSIPAGLAYTYCVHTCAYLCVWSQCSGRECGGWAMFIQSLAIWAMTTPNGISTPSLAPGHA